MFSITRRSRSDDNYSLSDGLADFTDVTLASEDTNDHDEHDDHCDHDDHDDQDDHDDHDDHGDHDDHNDNDDDYEYQFNRDQHWYRKDKSSKEKQFPFLVDGYPEVGEK